MPLRSTSSSPDTRDRSRGVDGGPNGGNGRRDAVCSKGGDGGLGLRSDATESSDGSLDSDPSLSPPNILGNGCKFGGEDGIGGSGGGDSSFFFFTHVAR